jgi:hypothetical protein
LTTPRAPSGSSNVEYRGLPADAGNAAEHEEIVAGPHVLGVGRQLEEEEPQRRDEIADAGRGLPPEAEDPPRQEAPIASRPPMTQFSPHSTARASPASDLTARTSRQPDSAVNASLHAGSATSLKPFFFLLESVAPQHVRHAFLDRLQDEAHHLLDVLSQVVVLVLREERRKQAAVAEDGGRCRRRGTARDTTRTGAPESVRRIASNAGSAVTSARSCDRISTAKRLCGVSIARSASCAALLRSCSDTSWQRLPIGDEALIASVGGTYSVGRNVSPSHRTSASGSWYSGTGRLGGRDQRQARPQPRYRHRAVAGVLVRHRRTLVRREAVHRHRRMPLPRRHRQVDEHRLLPHRARERPQVDLQFVALGRERRRENRRASRHRARAR